ncbi:MAG TPA: acylphosphatase [Candidatus Limnocylindria bacterium]|nr:acylphosphatase [Candidatus Limnocylindria bacterium]
MTDHRRLEAVVHGRVQGVGFRVFVLREARGLGLQGWVANESHARVRCVAEGPKADLDRLLERLRAGPPAASVDRVDASWSGAGGGHHGFEIRPGWHGGD